MTPRWIAFGIFLAVVAALSIARHRDPPKTASAAPARLVLLAYPIQSLGAASQLLNAGSRVYVCDAAKTSCTGAPYAVQAVAGKPEALSIVVRATMDEAIELNKIEKPQLRLAAVPE